MADEVTGQEKAPQEEKSVPVTDDALSSAWDQDQENVPEPEVKEEAEQHVEPKEEDLPEEPADPAERSRLGRRLKEVQDNQAQILNMLNELKQGKPTEVRHEPAAPVMTYDDSYMEQRINQAIEQGIIPETPLTVADNIRVNRFIQSVERDMDVKYQSDYASMLKGNGLKGNTPDDIHAEVIAELHKYDSPFNRRLYNNPGLDAQINYLEAKADILQRRHSGEKPTVFKGKKPNTPPTGTGVNTRTPESKEQNIELDEASLDFIKRTGMSEDSVKAALNNPLPFGFGRGR